MQTNAICKDSLWFSPGYYSSANCNPAAVFTGGMCELTVLLPGTPTANTPEFFWLISEKELSVPACSPRWTHQSLGPSVFKIGNSEALSSIDVFLRNRLATCSLPLSPPQPQGRPMSPVHKFRCDVCEIHIIKRTGTRVTHKW